MFNTKKDVDKHVRTGFSKLRTENEKNLRGYAVAKMYARIGEYTSALHYVSTYLSIKDDSAHAHRLAGQCHEKLKQPEKAIASYEQSLKLDPKQSDLIIEVCKLVLSDESLQTPGRLRFWCDQAEAQRIQDESVINLNIKVLQRNNLNPTQIDEMLQKGIVAKPNSVKLRIQMVKHMLDQNRLDDAFKYTYDLEQKQNEFFAESIDWYNCINQVLTKLAAQDMTSNWMFWLMSVSTIERQTYLTLCASGSSSFISTNHLADCAHLVFQFDQTLEKAVNIVPSLCPDRQLAQKFIAHFQGQLCLHAATLIYKRESVQKAHWRDIQRNALPLLLLAHNAGVIGTEDKWVKNSTESIKQLICLWHRQSAFRCLQAGRTILSYVDTSKDNTVLANIRKICTETMQCTSNDELIDQIRQYCSDGDWRRKIFRVLFTVSDQANKYGTSFLVQSRQLANVTYEIPHLRDLEQNAIAAQWLRPSSLEHQVYLVLGASNSADFKCNVFEGLNMSVSDLNNCGAETLNQLDVDTVLAATTFQTQLRLTTERAASYDTGAKANLQSRPFAIVAHSLTTEEQSNWWLAAYKVLKNLSTSDDLGEVRATLQHGIEAVRGVGGPKMDILICLKLGQMFVSRSQQADTRSNEKNHLETRAEALYKFALHMIRMKSTASLGQYRALFKYPIQNAFDAECAMNTAAEEAVTFLVSRYFSAGKFQQCIDELQNIDLPFATYFIAEAYRKLGQSTNTPKKNKRANTEKAMKYLQQTLELLEYPHVDKNHALRSVVHDDIKSLQEDLTVADVSFTNGIIGPDDHLNDSSVSTSSRRIRDVRDAIAQPNVDELKIMMMKMMETLTLVQDDVLAVRTRLGNIEEKMNRKNDSVSQQQQQQQSYQRSVEEEYLMASANNFYANPYASRPPVAAGNPYNSNLYNTSFPPMQIHPNALQAGRSPMVPQIPYADPNLTMFSSPNIMGMLQHSQQPQYHTPPNAGGQLPQAPFVPMQMPNAPPIHQAPPPTFVPPAVNTTIEPPSIFQLPVSTASAPAASVPVPSVPSDVVDPKVAPAVNKNWNPALNNAPVEKSPPVNVVITSSDPLPLQSTVPTTQPKLSVTIPSHHIKNSITSNNNINLETQPTPAAQSTPISFGGVFVKTPASLTKTPVEKNKTPVKEITTTAIVNDKKTAKSSVAPAVVVPAVPKTSFAPFTAAPPPKASSTIPEKTTNETTTKPSPFAGLNFSKPAESSTSDKAVKPSPFANFTFGTTTTTTTSASPFASFNIGSTTTTSPFGSLSATTTPVKAAVSAPAPAPAVVTPSPVKAEEPNDAEEYVPTAHFEPVIALPDLVDTKTGEEEEHIRFEHRAKLMRFVKDTKEWKERGLGQMKVLVHKKDSNKVRLLMRREQVLKLCCNQLITKETKFTPDPKGTSLTWYGQDYSENELQVELFAIRFKTAEICKQFHDAVLDAQKNIKVGGDANAIQKQEKPTKETEAAAPTIGFGDKFKAPSGSWNCTACYVSNKATDTKCVACNSASPNAAAAPAKTSTVPTPAAVPPKAGTGFGDLFKPKAGSWECKGCYISNKGDALYCVACNSPKDDTVPAKPKEHALLATSANAPKFTFGVQMTPPAGAAASAAPSAIKEPVTTIGGAPTTTTATTTAGAFSFGTFTAMSTTTANNIFGGSNFNSTSTPTKPAFGGFPFGSPKVDPAPATSAKPALSITNNVQPAAPVASIVTAKDTFSFTMKPKSPSKAKSPQKVYPEGTEDVSDDENIEEENNTYFTPVIPLPDKIEVVTGEENEMVLYSHRAKLYRFSDSEWKERGLGDVKILKHKVNGKMRVVMRREQILKICLNHALTDDIEYKPKDDKSWHFVANDYSEGEVELTQFCLRFKNAEIANAFKKAIDAAVAGTLVAPEDINGAAGDSAQISDEDRRLAESLKLPPTFFVYKHSTESCSGCRACQSPEFQFAEVKQINTDVADDNPIPLQHPGRRSTAQTPNKSLLKPAKIEATPPPPTKGSSDKNVSSIFGGNVSSPFSFKTTTDVFGSQKTIFGSSSETKENVNGPKPLPNKSFTFGNSTESSPFKTLAASNNNSNKQDEPFSLKSTNIFGSPATIPTTTAVNDVTPNAKSTFSFADALSKFATENAAKTNNTPTAKTEEKTSIFGGTAFNKPAAESNNEKTTIFGNLSKDTKITSTTPDTKSIFGANIFKPAESTDQKAATSIFGNLSNDSSNTSSTTTATTTEVKPIFGGAATFKPADETNSNKSSTTSLFGNLSSASSFSFGQTLNSTINQSTAADGNESSPFKDTGLSFAALATNSPSNNSTSFGSPAPSSTTGFIGLSKTNDFNSFSKQPSSTANLNGSGGGGNDDSTAGGEDATYDPHYDPIIALPDEIEVRTGEEDEEKVFGERAKLYRFDTTNREWKERGVGELKILHHPGKNTYRLLMRREQVHKCVLNHALNGDIIISPMQSSDKAFCWATNNYADDPAGAAEQLSVRFKDADIAATFDAAIKKCMSQLKLGPEDD